MPRQADPELEKRVLDAAQKLWRGGGDKTLSMRALARAARTNTPAIYRRFKDRKDILQALLLRVRTKQVEAVQSARSLEEAIDLFIDFALRNPWEYELYYLQEHEQLRPAVSTISGNRPRIHLAAAATCGPAGRITRRARVVGRWRCGAWRTEP